MSKARQLADLGNVYDDGALSNRNKLINSAMVIDQRNGGAAVSIGAGNTYGVDRWKGQGSGGGAWTAQQSTEAPAGFTNSTLLTVTTADASIAASDYYIWGQAVEGFNAADLDFGSSDAKYVTLSFWVRSSITGNYALFLDNSGDNRTYVTEYTINSANTWEYKTITISGDTSGSWLTNNGIGIALWFTFGAGSNFNATADAWNASLEMNTSGSTQWISTLGATFYITGIQLEVGDTATPFEHRSYGDELARCLRYFYKAGDVTNGATYHRFAVGYNNSSTNNNSIFHLPVVMRAKPSVSQNGTLAIYSGAQGVYNTTAMVIETGGSGNHVISLNSTTSGITQGNVGSLIGSNDSSARINFDAEL